MKRAIIALGLIVSLVAAPSALAGRTPSKQDQRNASKECSAERGSTAAEREAFYARYRTFGRCVSVRTRDEHAERHAAVSNAARQCRAERASLGVAAFNDKYGVNAGDRNAFGKCVSQKARANKAAADARDRQAIQARKNAARVCAEERGSTPESRAAFAAKYGENSSDRNAFGKCVSQKARARS